MMLVYFIAGILLLIKGGDLFVNGSIHIARRTGIPRMLIGGTIVSLATTAPELVVSTFAGFAGNPELAIGNAVGSVIANTGLIVGLTALIKAIKVRRQDFKWSAGMMVALSLFLTVFVFKGELSRRVGLILILSGVFFLVIELWRSMRNKNAKDRQFVGEVAVEGLGKNLLHFGLGALMVVIGSRLLVFSSIEIAQFLGVPSLFIGLTVVAVGTSLPELVTALVSVKKGVADLSLGNVIGANILCITFVSGSAVTIHPFKLQAGGDIFSLMALLLFVIIFSIMGWTGKKISRREGFVLLVLYVMYVGLAYFLGVQGAVAAQQ